MVDRHVSSLTSCLKNLIRVQHRSLAKLERDVGWKAGTISRLLSGQTKMTVRHLVLLLRAMNVPLAKFSDLTFLTSGRLGSRTRPKAGRLFGGSMWDPWSF